MNPTMQRYSSGRSVGRHLNLTVGAILALFLLSFVTTLVVLNAKKQDARGLNLAGRQRMLSQRFVSQTLSERMAPRADKPPSATTKLLFETTNESLRAGGKVYLDLKMSKSSQINASPSSDIRDGLRKTDGLFKKLVVLAAQPDSPADELVAASTKVLASAHATVVAMESESQSKLATIFWVQTLAFAAALALCIFCIVSLSRLITHPIERIENVIHEAADGDLTVTFDTAKEDNEIGRISQALGNFVGDLRTRIVSIRNNSQSLNGSAEGLADLAPKLASDSESIRQQSAEAAQTSAQMSSSMATVAAAAEQSSANVRNVAAAVEEMSNNLRAVSSNMESVLGNVSAVSEAAHSVRESLDEVGAHSDQSRQVAANAGKKAEESSRAMNELSTAARDIEQVVGTITEIAERTDLLALNATIEAASAGEAGRGFAVVANEVKELAKQTATATAEIERKVQSIRVNTGNATGVIGEVAKVIVEVSNIASAITSSVEKQRTTTDQVLNAVASANDNVAIVNRNVKEASLGADEVARNAEELANGANEIARSASEVNLGAAGLDARIKEVSQASEATSRAQGDVDEAARSLREMSSQLNQLVANFHT